MIARFAKAWSALVAGLLVVLGAGLITGSAAVWISTGIAAVGAVLAVLLGPANAPKVAPPAPAARDVSPAAPIHIHVHTDTGVSGPTAVHTQTFTSTTPATEPEQSAELHGAGPYRGR